MKTIKNTLILNVIALSGFIALPGMQAAQNEPKSVKALIAQFGGGAQAAQQPKQEPYKKTLKNGTPKLTVQPTPISKPQVEMKKTAQVMSVQKEQKNEADAKITKSQIHRFKSLQALQTHYEQALQQEEKKLMDEFFKQTKVSQAQFATCKEQAKNHLEYVWKTNLEELHSNSAYCNNHIMSKFGNSNRTAEEEGCADKINAAAKKLFHQEKMPLPEVFFDHVNIDVRDYKMKVTPYAITVEMPACQKLSDIDIEESLLHEIGHLINDDAVTATSLNWISKNKSSPFAAAFIPKWRCFIEKRADLFAWTKNIGYAKSGAQEHGTSKPNRNEGITHPRFADRAALAQQIYNEMLALPKA